MADNQPTVWQCEPHTLAKHKILTNYLEAWVPIMSRHAQKIGSNRSIAFVDAFAGPGIYLDDTPGSPIKSIRTILEHAPLPKPIHLYFIEEDEKRYNVLKAQLDLLKSDIKNSKNIDVHDPECGDCNLILNAWLDEFDEKRKSFGPALVFLDQFGYGAAPMSLIERIMRHGQCEVLTFIEARRLNWTLGDEAKRRTITRAFGDERWRDVIGEDVGKRSTALRHEYRRALQNNGRAKYVWDFAMLDEYQKPICWLFFGTNSDRGLEEMKKAMLKVDERFAFADSDDPDQLTMFNDCGSDWLRARLESHFAGQVVTVGEVRMYVLMQTPLVNYAELLTTLQSENVIIPIGKRIRSFLRELDRKIRFPDVGLPY